MRFRSVLLAVVTAGVVLVIALTAAKSVPSAPTHVSTKVVSGKTVSVKISNFAFHPDSLTVKVGTKITVTNTDQTAHTLTAKSGAFDTGTINPGKSMTITVTKAGTYPFYCQFHAFMTGTLKVVS